MVDCFLQITQPSQCINTQPHINICNNNMTLFKNECDVCLYAMRVYVYLSHNDTKNTHSQNFFSALHIVCFYYDIRCTRKSKHTNTHINEMWRVCVLFSHLASCVSLSRCLVEFKCIAHRGTQMSGVSPFLSHSRFCVSVLCYCV